MLAGKYNNGIPEGSRLDKNAFIRNRVGNLEMRTKMVKAIEAIAQEIGATVAQFSIAWCAVNKNVSTVMLGASSVVQMEENLKAIPLVDKITPEMLARVEEIVQFQPTMDSYDKIDFVKLLRPNWTG